MLVSLMLVYYYTQYYTKPIKYQSMHVGLQNACILIHTYTEPIKYQLMHVGLPNVCIINTRIYTQEAVRRVLKCPEGIFYFSYVRMNFNRK